MAALGEREWNDPYMRGSVTPANDFDWRVRDLCRQILEEPDPAKVATLLASLQDVLKEEQEQARLRMSYIAKHFRNLIQPAEGRPEGTDAAFRIRSMLAFLGLLRDEHGAETANDLTIPSPDDPVVPIAQPKKTA